MGLIAFYIYTDYDQLNKYIKIIRGNKLAIFVLSEMWWEVTSENEQKCTNLHELSICFLSKSNCWGSSNHDKR